MLFFFAKVKESVFVGQDFLLDSYWQSRNQSPFSKNSYNNFFFLWPFADNLEQKKY